MLCPSLLTPFESFVRRIYTESRKQKRPFIDHRTLRVLDHLLIVLYSTILKHLTETPFRQILVTGLQNNNP